MTLQRSSAPVLVGGARGAALVTLKVLAAVAVTALVVGVIVFARNEHTTAVDADIGTTWLSAESGGRIALVAPRAARPSLSTQLVDDEAAYDLADLGGRLVVHDRVEGGIIVFDAASGVELDRFDGPVTTDPRPALVSAGDRAYVVDADRGEVRVLAGDTLSEPLALDFEPSDWAAGADGSLWLVDRAGRRLVRSDGTDLAPVAGELNGDDFELTVFDGEPAVYEPSTGRLRWLRAGTSFDVPGAAGGGVTALLAEANAASACLVVLTPTRVSCHTREGVLSDVELGGPVPADGVVGGDDDVVVVAVTGSSQLTIIDVATGAVTTVERRAPSDRRPLVRIVAGTVMVDDPGSRYAYTITSPTAEPVETDKLSRRTVVITSDGTPTEGGLGNVDADAEVTGAINGEADDTPADDDGRNDPPLPRPDRATTRTGREDHHRRAGQRRRPRRRRAGRDRRRPALARRRHHVGARRDLGALRAAGGVVEPHDHLRVSGGRSRGLVAAATVTVELIGDGSNRERRRRRHDPDPHR
ncbi:MAG: hypothetical protein R2713_06665 [Ilumatobacteraceae bacterium]